MKRDTREKLAKWKDALDKNVSAFSPELDKISRREEQYNGRREIDPVTNRDLTKSGQKRKTAHVWNITAENIDAIIDSSIPMPKVVALRKQDEDLARKIENMLRNELERLPIETINDRSERTAKKQGAVGLMTEWDTFRRTHCTVGENVIRVLHPRKIVPQDGVEDLEDMDYFFVRIPMTRKAVENRYGVSVSHEEEAAPELRDGESAEDMVTLEIAYYRNAQGGIGRFVWVGDTVCEDLEDCQARRLRRCKKCGRTETEGAMMLETPLLPTGEMSPDTGTRKPGKDECPFCSSRSWNTVQEDFREVSVSDLGRLGIRQDIAMALSLSQMREPEALEGEDLWGAPMAATVRIPYYNPGLYPLVMMRNVTQDGAFLGESDCDKLADHQNTMNRLQQKLLDRNMKAGTKIYLPPDSHLEADPEDSEVQRVTKMSDIALIKVVDFSGNLEGIFAHINQVYTEAQRTTGVTESFLGRQDPTATSGKAKEFSAQQTVGRLESRRVLKKQAWGELFERLFKNMLAYADERRPIHYRTKEGEVEYDEFNPYEFLEVDAAGELYWNDQFLFTCDDSSGLASNREAMWQECTAHLRAGAYGNPQDINALIIYWTNMEELHYPGAGNTKQLLEGQRQQQMQAAMAQQQVAMAQQQAAAARQQGPTARQEGMVQQQAEGIQQTGPVQQPERVAF